MINFDVSGLDQMIADLTALKKTNLKPALMARGEEIRAALAAATPRRTGKAKAGWRVDYDGSVAGIDTVVVSNPVRSKRGFPYPSALLTGTGRRGAGATPAIGYHGRFGATPGMLPAANLQRVWNEASSFPLTSSVLKGVFP